MLKDQIKNSWDDFDGYFSTMLTNYNKRQFISEQNVMLLTQQLLTTPQYEDKQQGKLKYTKANDTWNDYMTTGALSRYICVTKHV